jgi:hypothetical protein
MQEVRAGKWRHALLLSCFIDGRVMVDGATFAKMRPGTHSWDSSDEEVEDAEKSIPEDCW